MGGFVIDSCFMGFPVAGLKAGSIDKNGRNRLCQDRHAVKNGNIAATAF
jgi:hypothetical protein